VVASGWNATLPFANPLASDHAWDRRVRLPGEGVEAWSTARCVSRAQRQFTKLSVVPAAAGGWALEVASYDEHGAVTNVAPIPL